MGTVYSTTKCKECGSIAAARLHTDGTAEIDCDECGYHVECDVDEVPEE